MKHYIKDTNFESAFSDGDLVREVDTNRVFTYDHNLRACNYNSTFERMFEVDIPPPAKLQAIDSLNELLDYIGRECDHIDHNGNCQTHGVQPVDECLAKKARETIVALQAEQDTTHALVVAGNKMARRLLTDSEDNTQETYPWEHAVGKATNQDWYEYRKEE